MDSKLLIILYRILFSLLRLLSRMPLGVHYFFADWLLYPIAYHLVRYRRKLVNRQLADCFPEKSEKERNAIARRFYHFFCDCIVETLKLATMPHDEVKRRVEFVGIEEMQQTLKQAGKKFGFFYLGHYGNWEWMASFQQWLSPGVTEMNVYRRLKNRAIDRLMLAIRAKRGGVCVEKQRILREMVRYRAEKKPVAVGLLCDQKPRPEVTRTWTMFLNQETGFLDGGEVLGRKFGYPVFYVYIIREQRGIYRTQMKLLAARPEETQEGEITTAYARLLEKNIREQPALWLWTHNRWKWGKVKSEK